MQKKALGIDYGSKRIGLAISFASLAEPYGILEGNWHSNEEFTSAAKQIKEICKKEGVEQLVLGMSESKTGEKTKRFGDLLEEITRLPLQYIDETLSSQQAKHKLQEAGKNNKIRRLDQYAAVEILQEYLDMLH